MSINIGPPAVEELRPRITVIGVGGAGGNAIANMIQAEIEGVDFVVANTDAQALNNAIAEHRIHILHRLAGRAFGQVVERRADDGAARNAVGGDPDEGHVRAAHMPGLRRRAERQDVHERLVRV